MKVQGRVRIQLSLNVYDLETDAVEVKNGTVKIVDDDQFFMDWCDQWEKGIGELLGASVEFADLKEEGDEG